MGKFADIPVGTFFKAGGKTYRKVDALYFVDPSEPDMERMVSPLFESTINEKVTEAKEGMAIDTTAKFLIDPVSRLIKPNPHYDPTTETKDKALEAFSKLWQSGLFKCESSDFDFIVQECLTAVGAAKAQRKSLDAPKPVVKKKAPAKAVSKKSAPKSKKTTKRVVKKGRR